MKLYAVCVEACPFIGGRKYPKRMIPVSKAAGLPVNRRGDFAYAPAVFTAKSNAEKLKKTLAGRYIFNDYYVIEFDGNALELPDDGR